MQQRRNVRDIMKAKGDKYVIVQYYNYVGRLVGN